MLKRNAALLALVVLFSAGEVHGQTRLHLTISGGKHDQVNVPVQVPITVPEELATGAEAVVRDPSGKALRAQLTEPNLLDARLATDPAGVPRELHLLLPSVKAGEVLQLETEIRKIAQDRDGAFQWESADEGQTDLRLRGRPSLRYMHLPFDDSTKEKRELSYKVYHHLFEPTGTRTVTKGPGGLFPHHRGLYFGFNRISYGDGKKADTWHCTGDAYQDHEKFLAKEQGDLLGRHRVLIRWHGPGKEVFAREERELTLYDIPGGRLVEFATRLRTTDGPVQLDGDPQHAGFQFRADNEVAAKTAKQTIYIRPDGVDQPGKTRNWPMDKSQVNLPWYAMSFVIGDKRYTTAYLDRPENPKEARFSERDYGRFGSYFVYTVTKDKPLALRYRLWLQEGQMTPEQVAALATQFTDPPRVAVK